jgi:hypothetical protein
MGIKKSIPLIVFLITPFFFSHADEVIVHFNEPWTINILSKHNTGSFRQEQDEPYTIKKPWDLGIGVRYKKISATVFLPSFHASGEHPFESFDIQLASYYERIYYEAFCKKYQGFTNEEAVDSDIDLRVFSSGISTGWLQNSKNHSLSAVYDLDCNQLSSSGSAILGLGVYYTALFSDNEKIKHYNDVQHFVCFGPTIGYSYTFIFSGNIFLNMNLVAGLDAGLNIATKEWLFIPLIMPKISFGHHNKTWSLNFTAACNRVVIPWDINTVDRLSFATIKATFSKRF